MTSDIRPTAPSSGAPAVEDEGRGRRWRALLVLLLLGALLAWGAYVVITLVTVRTELTAARQLAEEGRTALLDADPEAARQHLGDAEAAFSRSAGRLGAPGMLPLRAVPVVRANVRAGHALAAAGARVAAAGEDVAGAVADLPGGMDALVPDGGAVPLEPLDALAPALARADALLAEGQELAASAPERGLVEPLAAARAQLMPMLDEAAGTVGTARTLVEALPAFLGADGPRRYFFGAGNPAELRGVGGFVGAYAILTVDEGRLAFGDFAATSDLPIIPPDEVEAPNPEYAARFAAVGGAGNWVNLNLTADFPSAATAFQRLWAHVHGEELDGVIVADPMALQALLDPDATLQVPAGGEIPASQLSDFVLNEAYAHLTDPDERKFLLGNVAAGAVQSFLSGEGRGDPASTLRALAAAAADRHLLLFAADPTVQAAFDETRLSGRLGGVEGDYLNVITNQAGGNKIDFYAERTVQYDVDLREGGGAVARATVDLTNHAPTTGQPPYVIGPNADFLSAGDSLSSFSVYCAPGCHLQGFARSLGNRDVVRETELGHPVYSTTVHLPSGGTERLQFDWEVPGVWEVVDGGGVYRLTFQSQATVRPTRLILDVGLPDGREVAAVSEDMDLVDGRLRWEGDVTGTRTFEIAFSAPADTASR